MEVRVAGSAGFCFGVQSAVDKVRELIAQGRENIFTFGPLIHNESVERELSDKGVRVLLSEEELSCLPEERGTLVIRSHGVSEELTGKMEATGYEVVDATCPFVAKIHDVVRKASSEGRTILVIGDARHPEVQGICGWCSGPAMVIGSPEEVGKITFPADTPVTIVAQTTFNYNLFKDLVEKIARMLYDIIVVNTICHATRTRQLEAKDIAAGVDVMIVIGGKNSSNTQKLYDICRSNCKKTFYIQTLKDLDPSWIRNVRSVGITAGASTPKNIIEEVHEYVRNES